LAASRSVDHILHAGDVGNIEILHKLREIAPTTAIRGNIDLHDECAELPETEAIEQGGKLLYMVHSINDLDVNPRSAGIAAVISGHSHQPGMETSDGVLYLNPGSAGPRRFKLPVTLALLYVDGDRLTPSIVSLI